MKIMWKKLFNRSKVQIKEPFIPEYRIREAKFSDGRIEFFPEAKYELNFWGQCGDSMHIIHDKGYETYEEAEKFLEIRRKRDIDGGVKIVKEIIHSK